MSLWKKVVVRFNGKWQDLDYRGGEEQILPVPVGVSYATLLENVHCIVEADRTKHDYVLFSIDFDGKKKRKMKIKNDFDINYLFQFNAEPLIFVSVQNASSNPPTIPSFGPQFDLPGSSSFPVPYISNRMEYMTDWGSRMQIPQEFDGPSNNGCSGDDGSGNDDNDDINIDDIDLEDTEVQKHWFEKFCKYCEKKGMFNPTLVTEAEAEPESEPVWRRFDSDQLVDEEGTPPPPSGPGWKIPGIPPFVLLSGVDDDNIEKFDCANTLSLQRGSVFVNKDRLKNVVGRYHMEKKFDYRTLKSDKKRYSIACTDETCDFLLSASGRGGFWRVHSLNEHTCHFDPNRKAPKQLPSKMLGEYMSDKLLVEGQVMTPKLVQAQLKKEHCLTIRYGLALSIRNHAISVIYGDSQDSFRMIPSYLHMLEVTNPGTITDYVVDANSGKFRYMFYALGASIFGFHYARPIIVVDGTHLRGKYQGVLFVAVTKDGNNRVIRPIVLLDRARSCDSTDRARSCYSTEHDRVTRPSTIV
ncbi:hypothetical protein OROGR_024789 [Orobanche gracilis]